MVRDLSCASINFISALRTSIDSTAFASASSDTSAALVSAIAPERLLGLTGGMFNFVGNLASVGVPIVIGYLVKGGDFAPAITFIAMTAMAGAVCYGLVVGKVERIASGLPERVAKLLRRLEKELR